MSSTIIIKKPELIRPIKTVFLKSYWLSLGELRLNASFYAQDVSTANRLIKESGYELTPLESLSKDVFYLTRQKRLYAKPGIGDPYLTPSELFFFKLASSKFVFVRKLQKPEEWFVDEGWILLTRSGKLGMPIIATKSLKKFIISDDVIRIVPKEDSYNGFLYAFLCSWLGHALLVKDEYGVTVKHIEPHHVKAILIPSYPKEIQLQIHRNILKAFSIREKARNMLEKSEQMLFQELELEQFEDLYEAKAFDVDSHKLRLRLDASYHDPDVRKLRDSLRKAKYPAKKVAHNIGTVFIPGRFKRIYVSKEYGVPLLSGTQIAQIKPYDLKYISRKVTRNLEDWLIRSGWVLVTCSGTIGRVALAPKAWDGWAISQHVARIIPNPNDVHPGFLTAFLLSNHGYKQVISKTYGGVVDELAEDDMRDVLVPLPPIDVQEKIGKFVVEAYELREKANDLETFTIQLLEEMLQEGKKADLKSYLSTLEIIENEQLDVIQGLMEERHGQLGSWEELKKETGLDEV